MVIEEDEPAMTSQKRKKPALSERRFVPDRTTRAKVTFIVGDFGALLLGAGVYGRWLQTPPSSFADWLLLGGALLTVIAFFLPDPGSAPVRVGPLGVAVERGGEQPDRLAWWEIEKIENQDSAIVIHGAESSQFEIGLPHHKMAAAWIVAEALDRIPKRVKIAADFQTKLPSTKEASGVSVDAEPLQVAGRKCRSSGKLISFEDDARLCERCGEVYHRDEAVESCLGCEGSLAA